MEYTNEHYIEDSKIATSVFYRRFRMFKHCKEDLIQMAVIRLWQVRERFNETIAKYSTFAFVVAYRVMKSYLRDNGRFLNDLQIDEVIIEILPTYDKYNCDYFYLIVCIRQVLKNEKSNFKTAIKLFLQGKKQNDIADYLNMSRQIINRYIQSFRDKLKRKLQIEGYLN